ncbi:hypothetical protein HED22_00125 [Thalassospira sp. HF15]|uniref:hypothetical protein n=1 Tax=Thalassospira sp. HF15 TaxID=2722755 RepID=UPI00143027A8|nr:hypothetical protein [Thalassospira sp. HF15]NIY74042.1 hypothetical protein [Thalassospira sp. HF15]
MRWFFVIVALGCLSCGSGAAGSGGVNGAPPKLADYQYSLQRVSFPVLPNREEKLSIINVSYSDEIEGLRRHLLSVFGKVCLENLGQAEKIDKIATQYAGAEPFVGKTIIRGDSVNVKFYPVRELSEKRTWRAWLVNAGGLVCGVAAHRGLRFPQFFRQNLKVSMDKRVSDQFRDDVVPLTYGIVGEHSRPFRQYSLRLFRKTDQIDFIELISPEVASEDKHKTLQITGTFDPDVVSARRSNDDLLFATVGDVCIANFGDYEAMRAAAAEVTSRKKLGRALSGKSPFGHEVKNFVLYHHKHDLPNVSILSLRETGDICGYWEKGRHFDKIDTFSRFDIVEVQRSGTGDRFERIGYSEKANAAVVEKVFPVRGDLLRTIMFFDREPYDQIPTKYNMPYPWPY